MADFTDRPFCLICKKIGAQVIFREMVSADALTRQNAKTLKMIEIDEKERPIIQQIFGRDPQIMAAAAKIIYAASRPEGIDINMGCPARKVTNNFHGAALMKETELASRIVAAVKQAVPLPVSVKTRLGWAQKEEILSFAPLLEKAGADAISIHGRTKNQGYEGAADWQMIGRVKKILKIPVLANGGIFTPLDIKNCLENTRADGVLIARGALGDPWIFKRRPREKITLEEIKKIAMEHARLQVKHYGDYGLVLFRKHIVHYFKGLPHSRHLKNQLAQIKTLENLMDVLKIIQ